jgi:hypothetical protein
MTTCACLSGNIEANRRRSGGSWFKRRVAKTRERYLRAFTIALAPPGAPDESFEGRKIPRDGRQAKPVIKKLLPEAALCPVDQGKHVVQKQIDPGAVVERRRHGLGLKEVGDGVHVTLENPGAAPLATNPREQPGSGAPRRERGHSRNTSPIGTTHISTVIRAPV